jgi:hypothetical protein
MATTKIEAAARRLRSDPTLPESLRLPIHVNPARLAYVQRMAAAGDPMCTEVLYHFHMRVRSRQSEKLVDLIKWIGAWKDEYDVDDLDEESLKTILIALCSLIFPGFLFEDTRERRGRKPNVTESERQFVLAVENLKGERKMTTHSACAHLCSKASSPYKGRSAKALQNKYYKLARSCGTRQPRLGKVDPTYDPNETQIARYYENILFGGKKKSLERQQRFDSLISSLFDPAGPA